VLAFFVSHIKHSGFVSRLWSHFRPQIGSIHDAFGKFSLLSLGFLCEGFLLLFFEGSKNFRVIRILFVSSCSGGGESIWRRNEAILPCFFEFRWRVEHLKKENGAISTWVPSICSSVWLHFFLCLLLTMPISRLPNFVHFDSDSFLLQSFLSLFGFGLSASPF